MDASYGTNGVITVKLVEEANYANDLVIQADDKTILAGRTVLLNEYDFAMLRFTTEGELDPTFGNGGTVVTDIDNREDHGYALALQPDEKIIFAGYSYPAGASDSSIVVLRYDNDDTVGTEDNFLSEVVLYPNPASETITVQVNDASSIYTLEIVDALGRKISNTDVRDIKQIDVSAWAAGAYFINLNSGSQSKTMKFIKR